MPPVPRPHFFLCGAPKAGTTSLFQMLGQHPDIFVPAEEKEPQYFSHDLHFSRRRYPDEAAYLALFRKARPHQRIGEASTSYFFSEAAPAAIRRFCPEAKILLMFRNPVDIVHAYHAELLYSHLETLPDLAQALDAEPARRAGQCLPPPQARGARESLWYTHVARLGHHLQRYLDTFPREQLHLIFHEDLRNDSPQTYRQTLRFLGVDESFTPRFAVHNASRTPRLPALRRLMATPPPLLRQIGKALLPRKVLHQLYLAEHHLNSRFQPRQPLPPALRRRLEATFAPDIRTLERLTGRSLCVWLDPPHVP